MQKWFIYDTQAQAQAKVNEIDTALSLPAVGVNAATGQPDPNAQGTTSWAIPRQLESGKWVIPSADDSGQEWGNDWAFPDPLEI